MRILNKEEREAAKKEKKAYRETLAAERLKNAPEIAKARAKAEMDAEINKNKEKAEGKKGGGITGALSSFGKFGMGAMQEMSGYSTPFMDSMNARPSEGEPTKQKKESDDGYNFWTENF